MANKEEFINQLCYLFERWQDEREYENINDYLAYMQKVEPRVFAITKKPFGIKVKIDKKTHYFTVKAKQNDKLEIMEYIIAR